VSPNALSETVFSIGYDFHSGAGTAAARTTATALASRFTKTPLAALGPSYSGIRFSIIDINALVMLICSVTAFLSKGKGKIPLGVAGLLTTWLWAITGAINMAL